MAALHVIITMRALRDLNMIWSYIAREASPAVAGKFIGEILDSFEKLAEMPGIGHKRNDVRNPAYRFWRVKSYLVAYKSDSQALRVVRVVHGSRDIGRLFK